MQFLTFNLLKRILFHSEGDSSKFDDVPCTQYNPSVFEKFLRIGCLRPPGLCSAFNLILFWQYFMFNNKVSLLRQLFESRRHLILLRLRLWGWLSQQILQVQITRVINEILSLGIDQGANRFIFAVVRIFYMSSFDKGQWFIHMKSS